MLLEDGKLAMDESQRIAEHEAVKQEARRGVHTEIAQKQDTYRIGTKWFQQYLHPFLAASPY